MSHLVRELELLVKECHEENGAVIDEYTDRLLAVAQQMATLDWTHPDHKEFTTMIDQCAIMLWNLTVVKKAGGNLTDSSNAKLRHSSLLLVDMCKLSENDDRALQRKTTMALKTARAWLDAERPIMTDVAFFLGDKCLTERHKKLTAQPQMACGDGDSSNTHHLLTDIEKDRFKLLLYTAEKVFLDGAHEEALGLVNKAKEKIYKFPTEGGYVSMLCYNFGVSCFQASLYETAVIWLRLSYDIGRGISQASNQARTLRLLAHSYLRWDGTQHWQKALNAINLANAEHSQPSGLYMKVKILIAGRESDEVLKRALDDLLEHPQLSVDIVLEALQIISQYGKSDMALGGLQQLCVQYRNTSEIGLIMAARIEALLESNMTEEAMTLVKELIERNSDCPFKLTLEARRRIQSVLWEYASSEFQASHHSDALVWYSYCERMFDLNVEEPQNLGKFYRNVATCYLELNNTEETIKATEKAESCDNKSPFLFYLKYRLSLKIKDTERAVKALQQMAQCFSVMEITLGSKATVMGLICVAAQQAEEQSNHHIAMVALDLLTKYADDANQVLTSLRCLVRLRLGTIESQNDNQALSDEMDSIYHYTEKAYNMLKEEVEVSKDTSAVDVEKEAGWFVKIAWNMGLKFDQSDIKQYRYFALCGKLHSLCSMNDTSNLNNYKRTLLMTAATGLQCAKKDDKDPLRTTALLREVLGHIKQCHDVFNQLEKVYEKTGVSDVDNSTECFLILYEFEAKLNLGDENLDDLLDSAVALRHVDSKVFETMAALANESGVTNKDIGFKAIKVAIKRHLQNEPPDYESCSRAFHNLISMAFERNRHCKDELWQYYLDVCDIIENKSQGAYPQMEVVWLMTNAWNYGVKLCNSTKHKEGLKWCEMGLRLVRNIGHLNIDYETKMTRIFEDLTKRAEKPAVATPNIQSDFI